MISSNHHERGKRGALGNFDIISTLMTREKRGIGETLCMWWFRAIITKEGKEGHWGTLSLSSLSWQEGEKRGIGETGVVNVTVWALRHTRSPSQSSQKLRKRWEKQKQTRRKGSFSIAKFPFQKLRKRLRQTKKCTKTNKKKRRDNQTHLDKSRHTHKRSFPTSKSHTYKDTHTNVHTLQLWLLPHNSAGVGVHNAGERRLCRKKMIN